MSKPDFNIYNESLNCRELHAHGWLHRDIKPQNFCFDEQIYTSGCHMYLIDFGMAGIWRQSDGSHRPARYYFLSCSYQLFVIMQF